KVVSSLERLTKKSRVGIGTIFHYTRKRLQQISGVKVVYPRLICSSAVRPGAIVALPFHNISHSAYSQIAKVTFTSHGANGSQRFRGQQAGIENARFINWGRTERE